MEELKNVFVLLASYGEYDEVSTDIVGVFSTEAKAIEAKEELEVKIKSQINAPCPVDERHYTKWSQEEFNKWEEWNTKKKQGEDFNMCWVTEYDVK